MLNIELKCKSRSDNKPTLNTSSLVKGGFLRAGSVRDGDVISVKLVNAEGVVATQEFQASREGTTFYAKDGWNDFLFGTPDVGYPISVGICSVTSTSATRARSTARPAAKKMSAGASNGYSAPSKTALKSLLKTYGGVKTAVAAHIGVSTRTLGRWLDSAGL